MPVSIKKNYNLQVILEKLDEITEINEDGSFKSEAFEYDDYRRLLSHTIKFPKSAVHVDKENIAIAAFKNCLVSNDISQDNFIREVELVLKNKLSVPEETFYVLTSINIELNSINTCKWCYLGCEIEFLSKYPDKFSNRFEVVQKLPRTLRENSAPAHYSMVVIKVKSTSKKEAIRRGIDALNLLRAFICIEMNSTGLLIGETYKPINSVRLGKVHTIHDKEGNTHQYPIHYEPKFNLANIQQPKDSKVFQSNLNYFFERLNVSGFNRALENALLRFADALDESDNNLAVTKLWGALESLVVSGQPNCDLMPSRIAARYTEFELTKQIVMHIREYRNSLIHKGIEDDESIHRAFHLQRFFKDLLIFYISPKHEFSSLEEANEFLDKVSLGQGKLESEMVKIQKALHFLNGE